MKQSFLLLTLAMLFQLTAQSQKAIPVSSFDKVIVSPHISSSFIASDKDEVVINSAKVSDDKINIEVKNHTLRIYLDGAKEITKMKKMEGEHYSAKKPLYKGTQLEVEVHYRKLQFVSLRGEEKQEFKSDIRGEKFQLRIYGTSQVTLKSVALETLKAKLYGESMLEILSGAVAHQDYTTYGESKINTTNISGKTGDITSFGESDFNLNISDRIKLTAFGETKLSYSGNASLEKALTVGHVVVSRNEP